MELNLHLSRNLYPYKKNVVLAFLTIIFCAGSLTAKLFSPVRIASAPLRNNFKVSNQEKVLTAETAAALINELTDSLKGEVDDEEKVSAVTEKWKARGLVGKTRKQAVELLMTDVRAVVDDEEIVKKLSDAAGGGEDEAEQKSTPDDKSDTDDKKSDDDDKSDTDKKTDTDDNADADKKSDDDDKSDTDKKTDTDDKADTDKKTDADKKPDTNLKPIADNKPKPMPKPAPVVKTPPKPTPATDKDSEAELDLGARPISDADVTQVMKWIAVKVSAQKLPFCWKQTYMNNGVVKVPMDCGPGEERDRDGLICYPKCREGYEGTITRCVAKCPPNTKGTTAEFCQKASYDRGGGFLSHGIL